MADYDNHNNKERGGTAHAVCITHSARGRWLKNSGEPPMSGIPGYVAHRRETDGEQQSVERHLFGVAALAAKLAKKLNLEKHGELLGLLHDFGKYSEAFQTYIKSAVGLLNQDEDEDWVDAVALKGKVDHSSAGAQFIWNSLSGKGPIEQVVGQILALCIASHHSGLIDCISSDSSHFGEDTFSKRMLKAQAKTHLDEVITRADVSILNHSAELLQNSGLIEDLAALIKRIIESNSGLRRCVADQQIGLAVRFLFSCLIDADRIDTADFEHLKVRHYRPHGDYVAWPVLIDRLESHLHGLTPRTPIDGLRKDISQHCLDAASRSKGIFTLTVPTGGGKTLASLRFALHHAAQRGLDRIVYVIPFTTIIDQNAKVVREILEPSDAPEHSGKLVLEHHSSLTPEQQTWREKILCENWDAPVVYTTMVQFLETLFGAGTRGARRMHQLANAVLIFDEVQTLPVNCVHLFNNAINFLSEQCNSTVVLCTATQPLLNRVNADKGAIRLHPDHELMPDVQKLFDDLNRVVVKDRRKPGGWTYVEVSELALVETDRAGSCLVIVNTKIAAKTVYQHCREHLQAEEAFHLSTDMCPAHRKHIFAAVKDRLAHRQRVLCVSTQLIEAGVDVDFHAVIRFAAGLDSIAQAAGRCNRNGRLESGTVHVVNPQEERLEKLPDIAIGRDKAERVMSDFAVDPIRYRNNLIGPEALRDYYEYYFFTRKSAMDYPINKAELGHDDTVLNLLSSNFQATSEYGKRHGSAPNLFLRQSFMAAAKAFKAIDAPTQAVVVPFGDAGKNLIADLYAAHDIEKEFALMRAAQQYTVNVFPHVLKRLAEAEAIHEVKPDTRILCLDARYYSEQFGLSTEPVSKMETLHVGN